MGGLVVLTASLDFVEKREIARPHSATQILFDHMRGLDEIRMSSGM
jgi:hypothetical protein